MNIAAMKKALACAVCAAILLPGPAGVGVCRAWAAQVALTPPSDAREAMRFFEQNGGFKDPEGKRDPLRSYVYGKGELTAIGKLLYRHLKASEKKDASGRTAAPEVQQEIKKRLEEHKETFDALRKQGEMSESQRKDIDKAISRTLQEYGKGDLGELSKKLSQFFG